MRERLSNLISFIIHYTLLLIYFFFNLSFEIQVVVLNLNVIVGGSEPKMRNSVETVNAAATAIVTAESRVQPSSVQVHLQLLLLFLLIFRVGNVFIDQ